MKKRSFILVLSLILSICVIFPAFAADPIPVNSIVLEKEEITIDVGKTVSLKATIDPKNATNKKLEWSSSDESIATVNNGKISGIAPGSAVITVKAMDDFGVEKSVMITVIQPIKKITTPEPRLLLAPNVTWKTNIIIEPQNATNQSLNWISSKETVATVDVNGEIYAVAPGKCTITGIATDGSKKEVSIAVEIKDHDLLILEPGEIDVSFETRNYSGDPKSSTPYYMDMDGNKVIVTDAVFESGHHFTSGDGRNLVSFEDKDDGYRYFEKDPVTGRIFETQVRKLSIVSVGGGKSSKQTSATQETIVSYKNGCVCEGSAEYKIRPINAGSEIIEIVTKKNGKVVEKQQYTVFVSPEAAPFEGDDEILRKESVTFNGHTYQLFYSGRVWNDAKKFCENHGGHLVTITSFDEQEFLEEYMTSVEDKHYFWIGMTRDKNNKFSSWITKEGISFTNWEIDCPHRNESDACAMIVATDCTNNDGRALSKGIWNDEAPSYYYIDGFICEWDVENSPNALQAK